MLVEVKPPPSFKRDVFLHYADQKRTQLNWKNIPQGKKHASSLVAQVGEMHLLVHHIDQLNFLYQIWKQFKREKTNFGIWTSLDHTVFTFTKEDELCLSESYTQGIPIVVRIVAWMLLAGGYIQGHSQPPAVASQR